jgi:hypothetical protein
MKERQKTKTPDIIINTWDSKFLLTNHRLMEWVGFVREGCVEWELYTNTKHRPPEGSTSICKVVNTHK